MFVGLILGDLYNNVKLFNKVAVYFLVAVWLFGSGGGLYYSIHLNHLWDQTLKREV